MDIVESLDILMAKIIKRIGKWVEWMCARQKRISGASTKATPKATTSYAPRGMSSMTPSIAQSPLPPTGGVDQPSDKNIPLDKTC